MKLLDGTTVEMPVPSHDDVDHLDVHGYRVRRSDGFIEFSTLPEVVHHLLEAGDPRLGDVLATAASDTAGGDTPHGSAGPEDQMP